MPKADGTPSQATLNLYREGRGWRGDDRAYDGSNAAPKRDLTARERDVLCGVISDVLGAVRRDGNTDCVPVRADQEWVNHLVVIRDVIDPRRDEHDE
jgi:hypothetical protein